VLITAQGTTKLALLIQVFFHSVRGNVCEF